MEMYTTRKGCFKKEELEKLASSLGFPSNIFIKELSTSTDCSLQSEYTRLQDGKTITAERLKYMLESGALNHRLEKIFNRYEAKYNMKVIVKAMSLLAHRQLSFSEISTCRMAFELYSMEDGSGLPAELVPVSQALKMMDRVMAPTRLEAEIGKQQHYCDLPSRIQMYEFYDLVIKCLKSSEAEREMEVQIGSDDGNSLSVTSDSSLPDISKMLMTTDQQVLDYLDKRYRASLFKKVDPTPVPLDNQRIISMAPRRILRTISKEHSCALVPPLELSQQQLHQARNGRMVLSASQCATVEESLSRPHTAMSMDYRTKHNSGRFSQLQLRQRPKQIPSTQLIDSRPVTDPVFLSKSAPNILLGRDEERDDATDTGDITNTISKICVDSVYRAREAVSSSVASLPQLATTITLPAKLQKRRLSRRLRTPTVPVVKLTAIVSKEEMRRHQDSISELEWERLRKFRPN